MRWAVVFLPSHIMEFTNFSTSVELYSGSGTTSLGSGRLRRGIQVSLLFLGGSSGGATLGALGSIFRTALLAVRNTGGIESAAHHVIADTGQVLDAASADQHNRVLLEVVADTRYIGCDFDPVGQPHARHFPQSRIRLLRSGCIDAGTNTAPLRAGLQGGTCGLEI